MLGTFSSHSESFYSYSSNSRNCSGSFCDGESACALIVVCESFTFQLATQVAISSPCLQLMIRF